jgi:uncharacterized protein (DUF433 family)
MTVAMDGLIAFDDRGIPRVAGSRSRVVDIVLDQQVQGWTPEQIREQHPHLNLAQIHAALAYYHSHKTELDESIERGLRMVDDLRAAAGESPVAKRLRSEGLFK